jgi:hypothetical protein
VDTVTVTTYSGWLTAGSPWKPSNPSTALSAACKAHGYEFGIIGNVGQHLKAKVPEDHCPYSATPWPGAQPYPYVLAVDLMTTDPKVAQRIIAAKRSGRLPCLKYINWTDGAGRIWHTKWQPSEATTASTDGGHIHCSWRSDHATCNHATGFDPFIDQPAPQPTGDDMTLGQIIPGISNEQAFADIWAMAVQGRPGGDAVVSRFKAPNGWSQVLSALATGGITDAQVDAVAQKISAALVASNGNSLTPSDHAAVVKDVQAALRAGAGA